MKRIIFVFIGILTIISLLTACTSCAITNNSTNQSLDIPAQTDQPSPHNVPPQPIKFDTIKLAISFIKERNLSGYPEEWHQSYQSMIEILSINNKFLIASHTNADKLDDGITFFPEAKYEDVGVGVWFKYEDISYQVIIYNIKSGTEFEDLADYYEKRLGIPEDYPYDYVHTNNFQIPQILIRTIGIDNSRLSARCLIDDTHYIEIKTKADKNTLLRFVNSLQVDSISI